MAKISFSSPDKENPVKLHSYVSKITQLKHLLASSVAINLVLISIILTILYR